MNSLRYDLGTFCTATLVAATLAITAPTKANTVLEEAPSFMPQATIVCQGAKDSTLSTVRTSHQAYPTLFKAFARTFQAD
ncbi:hypothetical protein IFO70_06495 [Phormidium tenue FACHB-886]|nr:hypothetical protein [Phormidium tenue FACHB-886]